MKSIKLMVVLALGLMLFSCENDPPDITSINNPEPLTIRQFENTDHTLEDTLDVTLEDDTTKRVTIDWERPLQDFEALEPGTFEIEGTIKSEAVANPQNLKAVQTITVEAANVNEALDYSDATYFTTMYETFEHPDKDAMNTLFVPSDAAIQSILDFLEMDLETLMDQTFFEALMLDHMSAESISKNQLETRVPNVYTTLRDNELIVEGELGSPLIDSEHSLIQSYDLDTKHVHLIDGMILSDDTLNMVGSGVFDDDLQARLLEILRSEGFIGDLLLGRTFTIFIPSETALLDYAEREDISLNAFLESSEFETIILSHVVRAEYSVEDLYLEAPLSLESVSGDTIEVTLEGGELYANTIRVSDTQTIDQVGTLLTIDSILQFEDE